MKAIGSIYTVFFFLLFWGPKFGPIPLAKKYVFSPILKENSPQNEAFKKKKSGKCDIGVSEVRINSFRALANSHAVNLRVASLSRASKGEVPIVT